MESFEQKRKRNESFFAVAKRARGFQKAALTLSASIAPNGGFTSHIDQLLPIYFLTAHAVELTLKSYVHFKVGVSNNSHNLQALFQICLDEGIKGDGDVLIEEASAISELSKLHSDHQTRYPYEGSASYPPLEFLHSFLQKMYEKMTPVYKSHIIRKSEAA